MKSILLPACLMAAAVPFAHASTVRANKLPAPKTMTCLQVKQAISILTTKGLLHIPWDTEVGPGAYVSEYEDANGVYYRAPKGAITERRPDKKETSGAGRRMTFAGGIYVPNDPASAPTLYQYYGTISLLTQPAPVDMDCSTLTYAVDPNTQKISVMGTAAAIGAGAAIGMTTGRFVHPHLHMSYGQAAGAGLAGGLIAGLIIGAIEKSKEGEIVEGPSLDSQAEEKIRMLVTNRVALKKFSQADNPNVVGATPAQAASTVPSISVAATSPAANMAVETAAMPAPVASTSVSAPVPVASAPPQASPAIAVVATEVAAQQPMPANETKPQPATPYQPSVTSNAVTKESTSTAATSPQESAATAAIAPIAQSVAIQLGCGAVQANSATTFIAPCGTYSVLIDCDSGQCRPMHTVNVKHDE